MALNPTLPAVAMAVLRRLAPQLVEATLIPSALCYVGLWTLGLSWGILAAAVWAFLMAARRIANGRPVSGLLIVAGVGLSVRGLLYLLSHNAFVYFAQPVIRTLATASLFACSALAGRPLVARFATDFCSFEAAIGQRPAIVALFRRLTYLWAFSQAAVAAVTLTLLLTVPLNVFIGTAAGATWLIVIVSVLVTIADAVRTTRNDGLHTGLESGHIRAFVPEPTDAPFVGARIVMPPRIEIPFACGADEARSGGV
jgi:hypothetical protein